MRLVGWLGWWSGVAFWGVPLLLGANCCLSQRVKDSRGPLEKTGPEQGGIAAGDLLQQTTGDQGGPPLWPACAFPPLSH